MKLLVLDVEGTLFRATMKIDGTDYPSTMWQPIAHALGESAEAEERATHDRWDRGEYASYMEWVKATIDIHRRYSLKKDVFDSLIQSAEYNEGVEEFFQELDRREWIPVLISGGFQNLIRRAQQELDIEYGFGACEYHFDRFGYLEGYNLQPTDFGGKEKVLRSLLSEFGLNMKTDWVFVGDGKNDEEIARKAPHAFGINPHERLKAIDGLVEITSFLELLPYLEEYGTPGDAPADSAPEAEAPLPQERSRDTVEMLYQQILKLKRDNRALKQKLNDRAGKQLRDGGKLFQIPMHEIFYTMTPPQPLEELIRGIRVVFIGMDEHHAAFQRVQRYGIQTVSGIINNGDDSAIRSADFLFVYKNFAAHSAVWHNLAKVRDVPCCYLLEHSNEDLLENAMANVLYRYLYQ